ncbi:hypothetical protein P692DRAFT_20903695 [Suillus brevipes Sb2]|nr:hypothetical protein P692DRAFT_20903695 [Suillus brevipes Sb2]
MRLLMFSCATLCYWQELIRIQNDDIVARASFSCLRTAHCARATLSQQAPTCLLPSSFYFLLRVFCVSGPCLAAGQHNLWVSLNFDVLPDLHFLGCAIFGYLVTCGFFPYRDWSSNIQPSWAS